MWLRGAEPERDWERRVEKESAMVAGRLGEEEADPISRTSDKGHSE